MTIIKSKKPKYNLDEINPLLYEGHNLLEACKILGWSYQAFYQWMIRNGYVKRAFICKEEDMCDKSFIITQIEYSIDSHDTSLDMKKIIGPINMANTNLNKSKKEA